VSLHRSIRVGRGALYERPTQLDAFRTASRAR
jgi:hypothetical protein